MMNIDTDGLIRLTPAETTQSHAAIIGMTGAGKTNTLYVLAEELPPDVKVTIVDPEGDYGDLRFGTKALILGRGRKGNHIDIELNVDNAAAAADVMCRYDTPVIILDLSGFEIGVRDEMVQAYVGQLWHNYQFEDFPPHRLIVDEIQIFAPQSEKTESKHLLQDIAARARKRDFALAIATQQPQSVDKKLLNATRYRIFHRVATGTAMKAIKDLLPTHILDGRVAGGKVAVTEDMIASMATGDAIFMIEHNAKKVHIRSSRTFHPSNGSTILATQLPFDDGALDKLRDLISANKVAEDLKADVKREIADDKCLQELQDRITFLEGENKRLQAELVEARQDKAITDYGQIDSFAVPVVPSEVIERDVKRETEAEQRDLIRQRRGYQNLLLSIKRQSELDRRILSILADHDGTEYDTEQIKMASGLSANSHISMTTLVKADLISRRKVGRVYYYSTPILARVDEHYPLIGRLTAIEEIARLAAK